MIRSDDDRVYHGRTDTNDDSWLPSILRVLLERVCDSSMTPSVIFKPAEGMGKDI